MKRIICLILAAIICLTMFVGCDGFFNKEDDKGNEQGGSTESDALDDAIAELNKLYADKAGDISANLEVKNRITVGKSKYSVEWTVDNAEVKVLESINLGFSTVTIPVEKDGLKFTLTATVSDKDGNSKSCNFSFTVSAPKASNVLTIAEAIALGETKSHDTYTTEKYYVTGKITKITSSTYGNMVIEDASGNSIFIYGTHNANGTAKYGDMATKPAVGDTITVYTIVGYYEDSAQLKDAWITEINGNNQGSTGGNTGSGSGNTGNTGDSTTGSLLGSLDFSSTAQRTSWSTTTQVWQNGAVKLTNDKGAGGKSDLTDTSAPLRLFKHTDVTIECTGMTKIVFNCNVPTFDADYPSALINAVYSGATMTANGNVVTIVFSAPVNSFSLTLDGGQVRVDSIQVYGK